MEFGIGAEIGPEARESTDAVQAFVDRLSEFIRTRNYGLQLHHITDKGRTRKDFLVE